MKPRMRNVVVGAAVACTLMLVFAAYLNPHLAVELGNAIWACF